METRLRIGPSNIWSKPFYQYFRYLKKKTKERKHLYLFSKLLEVEICVRVTRKTKGQPTMFSTLHHGLVQDGGNLGR